MWTRKPQASPKLVLGPTGLTRDNGSGAMLKLHTCKLAHAHLLFALVITNTITLWAHFIHTCMDTPPLTTYVRVHVCTNNRTQLLYTVGLLPIQLVFSLYSWPSPYTVGLLPIHVQLAFSLYSGLLPVLLAFSL